MFSQANLRCLIKFTILPKDLAFLLQKCQHCSPIAPFHFHCFDDNHISSRSLYLCLVCFRRSVGRVGENPGNKLGQSFIDCTSKYCPQSTTEAGKSKITLYPYTNRTFYRFSKSLCFYQFSFQAQKALSSICRFYVWLSVKQKKISFRVD